MKQVNAWLSLLAVCGLQLVACTSAGPHPEPAHHAASPPHETSTLQVTFETTEANRQRARDADQPVLLKGQAPVYPDEADKAAVGNGWVELLMVVNPDGTVGNTIVLSSSYPAFEPAAIASVKHWQFEAQETEKSIRHRVFFKRDPADHYHPSGQEH